MTLYNPNLTLCENAHNYATALTVVGVVLLLYVFICHLTAKTEEQKDDVKTMFSYGVPTGIIALVVALLLFPVR